MYNKLGETREHDEIFVGEQVSLGKQGNMVNLCGGTREHVSWENKGTW
jgi:hypothetical protein